MNAFNKGQKVQFLNESGTAIFLRIDAKNENLAWVEDEFGFDRSVLLTELIPMHTDANWDRKIDLEAIEQAKVNDLTRDKGFKKQLEKGVMQVDLHIEELMEHHHDLSNHEIVMIQLRAFEQGLNKALEARQKKIIVIHGFGQGVLRSEIRKVLKSDYPQCEFLDASYQKYGFGATEILIKKN